MGDFFGPVQLPDWTRINALFSPDAVAIQHNQALASAYAPQAAQLQNETQQQNLDDRATLRGLSNGLSTRDPTAVASAASLPSIGGTNTVNALANTDAQRLALAQYQLSIPSVGGQPLVGGSANSLLPTSSSASVPSGAPAELVNAESGGNPAAVNKQGYSGSFQFGTGRMTDLGLYQPAQGENANGNQWQGTITVPGFAPMTHAQFLTTPDAQRMAAEVHFKDIGQQIAQTPGADRYNPAGLAAVAHLGGVNGMQQFVATNGAYNPHDANGVSLQDYYRRFSAGGVPAMQNAFGHPEGPLPADHPARQQVASASATRGLPQTATDASPGTVPATDDDVQGLLANYRAQADAQPAPSTGPVDRSSTTAPNADTAVSYDVAYEGPRPNQMAAGQSYSPSDAVAMAQRDLAGQLTGLSADDANRAVITRAQAYMTGTVPSATASGAAAQPVAAAGASFGPRGLVGDGSSSAAPQSVVQPAAPVKADAAGTPSSPAAPPLNSLLQGGSGSGAGPAAPSQPINALSSLAPQSQVPQTVPAGSSSIVRSGLGTLPAGARPVTTGAGTPYTQGAPPGYGWAQMPDRSLVPYPIVSPELKQITTPGAILNVDPRTGAVVSSTPIASQVSRARIDNPDGSQTFLDTAGRPMYTSQPNTRPLQQKDYEADRKSADEIAEAGNTAQNTQIRLSHALALADQIQSGANGGTRAQWASLAETYLPPEAARRFSASLIGDGGAEAAEQFNKLMIQNSGQQERGVLGARGGYQATKLFMQANPGLDLQRGSNNAILNMQLIQNQADADYANGALAYFNQNGDAFRAGKGDYQPLAKFDQQWLGQRNPQIYAAAMGAASGDPWEKWTSGLNMKSAADVQRVVDIVRRAKPNTQIQWRGGAPMTVGEQ